MVICLCLLSSPNSWSRRLSPKLPRRRTHDILTRSSQDRPSLLRHPDKVAPNYTRIQYIWYDISYAVWHNFKSSDSLLWSIYIHIPYMNVTVRPMRWEDELLRNLYDKFPPPVRPGMRNYTFSSLEIKAAIQGQWINFHVKNHKIIWFLFQFHIKILLSGSHQKLWTCTKYFSQRLS